MPIMPIGREVEPAGFKGRLSQSRVPDSVGFERANYANIIESYCFDPHPKG